MNFIEILPDSLRYGLGWTLIHSLWQGALILIMASAAQWLIAKRNASARYLVNCIAMALQLILLVSTFLAIQQSNYSLDAISIYLKEVGTMAAIEAAKSTSASLIDVIANLINSHINWLITGWLIGVVLLSIRLLSGLAYIQILKNKITVVTNEWRVVVISLSRKMGIRANVQLGESIYIKKPIIVGFVKPIILLPIGLLSHLSLQQVEAILTHELIHIKRHDYLINLVQSFVEIVLFFNPSTWILSARIRRERENSCDDVVIASGLDRMNYVQSLAKLEELSLYPTPALAMAFNQNRFQVFNRIKRIMENSINSKNNKARPLGILILLLTGLASAAWLAPAMAKNEVNNTTSKEELVSTTPALLPADTTGVDRKEKKSKKSEGDKSSKERSGSYSRQTITTFDDEGNPHEEVIESYEGDEDLKPLLANPGHYSFTIPPIPDFPPVPDIPFEAYSYSFDVDSLPGVHHFSDIDREKWEEFGRRMEERFKEFGEKNGDFGKMMEAWAENFARDFRLDFDGFDGRLEESLDKMQDKLRDFQHSDEFEREIDHGLRKMEEGLKKIEEQLKAHEGEFKKFEDKMKEYENELHDELVKDGYINKVERIESINWGDGKLTVNGIEIRERDIPKYEDLNRRYFKGNKGFYFRN